MPPIRFLLMTESQGRMLATVHRNSRLEISQATLQKYVNSMPLLAGRDACVCETLATQLRTSIDRSAAIEISLRDTKTFMTEHS